MSENGSQRLDALIRRCLILARSAPTGRILLGRVADALDPAWIPLPWGEEIASELELARAAAPEPISPRQVERLLRDAWGTPAMNELDELQPEPVVVTRTSQVHRGVLDGAPVAIKLLRPGLAAAVRQDLGLLGGLLPSLRAAIPALDAGGLISEFRDRVLDEFDLEHEAALQRRFHRALRGHPLLTVPAPMTRLAREGVLVSEWVDGIPIRRAPDPDRAAAGLLLFVLGCARRGVIHADPNPDDALVLPDGRLAIIDFGATRTVDPARVAVAAAGLEAFAQACAANPHSAEDRHVAHPDLSADAAGTAANPDLSADGFGIVLEQLGWLPASHTGEALALVRDGLGEFARQAPVLLDSEALLAARDRLRQRREALIELILAGALPPQDLWPARAVLQLFATISRISATGAWLELARDALRETSAP
ncbi:MAG: AarF/UbiB family protein [Solirubrobacteraceae bacterium]